VSEKTTTKLFVGEREKAEAAAHKALEEANGEAFVVDDKTAEARAKEILDAWARAIPPPPFVPNVGFEARKANMKMATPEVLATLVAATALAAEMTIALTALGIPDTVWGLFLQHVPRRIEETPQFGVFREACRRPDDEPAAPAPAEAAP